MFTGFITNLIGFGTQPQQPKPSAPPTQDDSDEDMDVSIFFDDWFD
jgi:hypothetical protein